MNTGLAIALAVGIAVASLVAINKPGVQDAGKGNNGTVDTRVAYSNQSSPKRPDKVVKTDAEWQEILTPDEYKILRNKGTEPPFCGVNLESKGEGVYHCAGCGLPLFKATNKFDSGTGWPSFYEPYDTNNVWYHTDVSYGMKRTEILCARCDGHLGHVFDDGPPPTHVRYCINGTVLKFVPNEK